MSTTETKETTTTNADEDIPVFDPTKKKRRKKTIKRVKKFIPPSEETNEITLPQLDSLEPNSWLKEETERDYLYIELLKRTVDMMDESKGGTGKKGASKSIQPPKVGRIGSTRTSWVNFVKNCKSLNRLPDHVMSFVLVELGTTGSLSGDGEQLIMKGRFRPQNLENLIKKYIKAYVNCNTCSSPNTDLIKENRITFKKCLDCGSTTSVASVKAGFKAVGKGDRRRERNAVPQ
eukprot:TRINITY_DN5341_c0_g2_i1.p1 TRINITY_DN5341_c0_g2~~TRINITY_DN5341_c0_g2_i1.p1  ORF type:complete len:233 (+),score=49.85 TRINITY_DN5341_c0_g2_i1:38-736(+)